MFHNKRHPLEMAESEINQFLTDLAVNKKVNASTQNQALSALLFLYQHVLKKPLEWIDRAVRAKKPKRLPVVLTREEGRVILDLMEGSPKLVATLLYGAGQTRPVDSKASLAPAHFRAEKRRDRV